MELANKHKTRVTWPSLVWGEYEKHKSEILREKSFTAELERKFKLHRLKGMEKKKAN